VSFGGQPLQRGGSLIPYAAVSGAYQRKMCGRPGEGGRPRAAVQAIEGGGQPGSQFYGCGTVPCSIVPENHIGHPSG